MNLRIFKYVYLSAIRDHDVTGVLMTDLTDKSEIQACLCVNGTK